VNKKTRVRVISVGTLLTFYAFLSFLSYNNTVRPGSYTLYLFIFAVLIPVVPPLINYYFKRHKVSCTRCGAENSYNEDYCKKCGMKLEK
jgi:ribosomal protein L40E